ncbi:MAG: YihY/virulence factor BrkB family protein [Eubacteriaceae bacterium]|nr:YihY/virulence factor BrkB family protein [Eubacteriaceae bacterium]
MKRQIKRTDSGIKRFARELFPIIITSDFTGAAAQLAYALILSFIPLLMFVITIAARIELPVDDIYRSMALVLPAQSYSAVEGVMYEITESKSLTGFSLFSALSFIAMGCRGFMRVSNRAEGAQETRGLVKYWLESYIFALMIVISLVLSLILVVFGHVLSNFANRMLHIESPWILDVTRYIVFIGMSGLAFSAMYSWSNINKKKLSETAPGGYSASILWVVVSAAFGYYVSNFSSYGLLFGSLGGIFMMLVWLYYSSYVLVLGICINSAVAKMNLKK